MTGTDVERLPDDPRRLRGLLKDSIHEIERLKFQLALAQKARFGRKSERHAPGNADAVRPGRRGRRGDRARIRYGAAGRVDSCRSRAARSPSSASANAAARTRRAPPERRGARLPVLRRAPCALRLDHQRTAGVRTGEALCAGTRTREVCLSKLRRPGDRRLEAGAADREGAGRPRTAGGNRRRQVRRSPAALPHGRDPVAERRSSRPQHAEPMARDGRDAAAAAGAADADRGPRESRDLDRRHDDPGARW